MSALQHPVAELFAEAERCRAAKRLGEAERLYRQVLGADDQQAADWHGASWYGLGVIAIEYGRPDTAIGLIGKAIGLQDDVADYHAALGLALERLGRLDEAATRFQRALDLNPTDCASHVRLGTAWGRLGKLASAIACFAHALTLAPDDPAILHNLGFSLERSGNLGAALAHYEHVAALRPDSAEALNSLGRIYFALKRVEEALAVLERAVALMPSHIEAWNNLGTAQLESHRPAESLTSYDRVLALDPRYAMALFNRGNALVRLKRFADALASFARCQALVPDFAFAHFGESLCRLRAGDLPRGWEKYEWRAHIRPDLIRVAENRPWRGAEDIAGKTILLHSEQGFGDTLQFCRYAPLVAARGARVVLEVPPVLKRLMTTLDGVSTVVAQGEPFPENDAHCPLATLPLAFQTSLETIPARIPYLTVPNVVAAKWRDRLSHIKGPRIGLTWSGRVEQLGEMHRSIAPEHLAPLLACGVNIVSLQKEYRREDRDWLTAHPEVLDFSGEIEDFADTAALASFMDVVVTIDTATAHLAGALGLPVWIMLSYIGDWRWMEERTDSPWYPTAQLYRQNAINDWSGVIARVAGDLRNHATMPD